MDVLDIPDIIAAHLMNHPETGIVLIPEQVQELGKLLGLMPEEPAAGHA
jgi:hypothetical protein